MPYRLGFHPGKGIRANWLELTKNPLPLASLVRPTRIALHADCGRMGNVAGNVASVAKAAGAKDADLVVFPEMFLTGYAIGDDVQRLAFSLDDARLEPIRKACAKAGTHVVVGGPRRVRPGVVANSAFLFRPDGSVEAYDKRCLATFTTFQEGLFFKPGTTSPVWKTPIGNIGIGICYDLFFPEMAREQVLAGADLLLNISASPSTSQRFFEALFPARAIENAAFVAYTNLAGPQDGIVFWGGAQVWGPRGNLVGRTPAMEPGWLVAELDWADLTPAREFRPTLRDGAQADLGHLAQESSKTGRAVGKKAPPTRRSSLPPKTPTTRGPTSTPTTSTRRRPTPAPKAPVTRKPAGARRVSSTRGKTSRNSLRRS